VENPSVLIAINNNHNNLGFPISIRILII